MKNIFTLVFTLGFLFSTNIVSAAPVKQVDGCMPGAKYSTTTGKLCGEVLGQTKVTTTTKCVPSPTVKCATSVTLDAQPTTSLTVTSPNAGQAYQTGQSITINWTSTWYGAGSTLAIDLVKVNPDTTHTNTFLMSVSNLVNDGTETLIIPSTVPSATNYAIHMSIYDPITTLWQDAFSAGTFIIQAVATSTCTINSFTSSPTNIAPGGTSTLTWSTTGCQNVTIGNTTYPVNGSTTVGPLNVTTLYNMTASPLTTTCSSTLPNGTPCPRKAVGVVVNPQNIVVTSVSNTAAATVVDNGPDYALYTMKINVTANGGDVYIDKSIIESASTTLPIIGSNRANVMNTAGTQLTAGFAATVALVGGSATEGIHTYRIQNGNTATFAISVTANGTNTSQRAVLYGIEWGTSDSPVLQNLYTTNMGINGIYKTPYVYVPM